MKRQTIILVSAAVIVLCAVIICLIVITAHGMAGRQRQRSKGPESFKGMRLPTSLKPWRYDVLLRSDFVNFIFDGVVSIDVECQEDTNFVVLHSSELDVSDVAVTSTDSPRPTWESNPSLDGEPWFDEENQFLLFQLQKTLSMGSNYTIHVNFSGPLEQDYVGYYATPYNTSSGIRWIGSTQLAVTYARRAFPCFDEPAFKARFLLTLDHASDYTAISNMPLMSTTTLEDGWTRSKFNESVPMSTYLMAWTVFDFTPLEKVTGDGVQFRVWARPDALDAANYALNKGADIIDFYGEYFGTKFPLPKMDFVAVPGYQIIAMENWGMNVFEPAKFLYEEGVTTSEDQITICAWIAHELAHQWFGNLVTFNWWDDLWLNEGFASYVEYLGTNFTEPEWNMMDMFMWRDKYPVLVTDSLVSSRPISMTVDTYDKIFQQFDWISYNKGASILRMLSNFLGEDTFRKGLKFYLDKFAYNNTDKDGLWLELQRAAVEDQKSLVIDVKEIMDTWTLQMGYPVVTVTRDYDRQDGIHFTATQERFLLNPDHRDAMKHEYEWHIPLTFTSSLEAQISGFDDPPQNWLTPNSDTKEFFVGSGQNSHWLLANLESRGYYRVNYDLSNWELLTKKLMTNHMPGEAPVIPPASRSMLINDAFNLARAGYLDIGVALNISKYLVFETDFVPWAAAEDVLGFVDSMLRGTDAYENFKQYMLSTLESVELRITNEIAGSRHDRFSFLGRRLTAVTSKLSCSYGLLFCLSAAASQFSDWMVTPTTNMIEPDVRVAYYCSAISQGGPTEWEFAFDQYRKANSDTEKATLLAGMTCTQDKDILKRYLSYLLTIDVISDAHHERVLSGILANEAGTELAWNFFWENFDTMLKIHGENFFNFIAMATSLTATLNTEEKLSMLKDELAKHTNLGAAQRTFTQGIEITEANIRWMQINYDKVAAWLHRESIAI